ncbi:Serine/threonine-protein kinase MRCK gamma like [Actinidia chinensis var. chinensis]|uniref:Serine/threonine-protein kinase MRCK gamma like n=1 Tax=Actinidia chinensis var. chinensis TaxID=1590841 RepID=A0A2R6PRL8_ACTCC|nr:Serine/threonine-protein kinase MRCK gamma like [Actinidia chinensis var. chinensis]
MKFLLELVACCRSGSNPSRAKETLVLAPPEDSKREREATAAVLKSRSAAEWRPSLCSISEDNMTAERERERERVILAGSERMIKRKAGSTTAGKKHVRSYSDDFGRNGFSTIMPMFSPTPFFF